jgi:ATP-dependent DNA helicase RecG
MFREMENPLEQSSQFIKGVGPRRFEQLRRLGLETVGDLLFHFPRTYEDLTDVRPIAELRAGSLQTVHGEVVEIEGRRLGDGRPLVSIVISDGGPRCLEGVWFNQVHVGRRFKYGQRVAFGGKPKWYRDHWQMTTPRVSYLEENEAAAGSGIVPIYPLTADLRADQLHSIIREAVEAYAGFVAEIVPPQLQARHRLPEPASALRRVHFPETIAGAESARRRFVYTEFLVLQAALAVRRRELRDRLRAPLLVATPKIDARIRKLFPFRLTKDQDKAISDICADLAGERPMQRLLQADVGAGKTAVAVYALLTAVANKHQAALMAPTEVLAQQHWRTLERYLARSRVRRLALTGALTPRERGAALADIRDGQVDLVVGTQALLQEDVRFARLGLVIVDEQHKFGVMQRARIRRLGAEPHYLVMTATPIPRTVALTVFGDLDVSTIREAPPGRQPVVTRWVSADQRARTHERVREALRAGRQAYVVCPLVEESERLDLKAAVATHQELQAGPFREFRVGLLHGQLDENAKLEVMERFRAGEFHVLVSTLAVEVGIDVPNATVMILEHAERFGLSQLHQLRGRVSRGHCSGQCLLFADPASDEARERLRLFARTSDGFALAEHDVQLRGVGEFLGTRQHGRAELRFGDLVADRELLEAARKDAFAIVAQDPALNQPDHTLLRQEVLKRYGRTLDLATIG